MSEKIIQSRAIQKHDTETNWLKATNFIPKQGEIIVYDIDDNYDYERFKIGDGKNYVSDLLFATDYIEDLLENKVDKVSGKGLSTNDYTTTEKNKLAGIATGANKTVVDTALSSTSTNPVQNKAVYVAIEELGTQLGDGTVSEQIEAAIEGKANTSDLTALQELVGDTAVSTQITTAISSNADAKGSANTALTDAKSYTDTKISALINSAPTTLDTLGEIATAMEENADVVAALETAIGTKADAGHTHNYAGSSSAGGAATSANKLNTNAGSATQPVYFANGVPVKTTYTLGASVPSGAKFTDTTYSVATTSANGLMSAADKTTLNNLSTYVGDSSVADQIDEATDEFIKGLSVSGKVITYTKGDGSTGTITTQDTDTVYTHPTTSGNKHIPSGGSSGQILRWSADGTAAWGADNNTTYSAGTGISLSGTTFSNSGVRSIATGSTNGTISVNTNGTSAEVAVKGLGSAAYTASTAYATSGHTHSEISTLSGLVGDTAVSTQIANATELPIVTASSSDGIAYTATVSQVTSLTAGAKFIMIPAKASASKTPTLNVNSLGAKNLRRKLSNMSTVTPGYSTTWISASKPYIVMYDGTNWVIEGQNQPVAEDLYGTLAISKGGTGATTAADALTNLGIADTYATIAYVDELIGGIENGTY